MRKSKYRVMAYVMSTGLWDALGSISLQSLLVHDDPVLEQKLRDWQALYDDQFRRYPYEFDWDDFNRTGEELTRNIQEKLPPGDEIYYEPSDDREFFSPEDCLDDIAQSVSQHERMVDLRERKRSLLYQKVAWKK